MNYQYLEDKMLEKRAEAKDYLGTAVGAGLGLGLLMSKFRKAAPWIAGGALAAGVAVDAIRRHHKAQLKKQADNAMVETLVGAGLGAGLGAYAAPSMERWSRNIAVGYPIDAAKMKAREQASKISDAVKRGGRKAEDAGIRRLLLHTKHPAPITKKLVGKLSKDSIKAVSNDLAGIHVLGRASMAERAVMPRVGKVLKALRKRKVGMPVLGALGAATAYGLYKRRHRE